MWWFIEWGTSTKGVRNGAGTRCNTSVRWYYRKNVQSRQIVVAARIIVSVSGANSIRLLPNSNGENYYYFDCRISDHCIFRRFLKIGDNDLGGGYWRSSLLHSFLDVVFCEKATVSGRLFLLCGLRFCGTLRGV